jgi:ADP-ribose pyrophosphatase YjhB (NUDIX family)
MIRHFTATAFVTDSQNRVLLLWHKRMQKWMPPGGHVDENETPEDCAKRECKEETGLDVEIIGDAQPDVFADATHEGRMLKKPFAMLLENIPASEERGEPAHEHMDFLFLAKPIDESQALVIAEAEADQVKWFTAEDLAALKEGQIFSNVLWAVDFFLSAKREHYLL